MSASKKKSLKELVDEVTSALVEASTGAFHVGIENDDGGSCISIYSELVEEKEKESICQMRLNLHKQHPGRRFILYFCEKEYIDAFVRSKKKS